MKLKALILIGFLYILLGFQERSLAATKTKPLVLQIEMSNPRSIYQTSLIFRKKIVEFVTNVSQTLVKGNTTRLGRFYAPLNRRLQLKKEQIQAYKRLLSLKKKDAIDLSKVLKATGASSFQIDPHAPVIRIGGNGQTIEVKASHPYFEPLRQILHNVGSDNWSCISCAEYKKKGKSIVRVVKEKGRKPASNIFSTKTFQCFSLNRKQIECLDVQFGCLRLNRKSAFKI